MQFPATKHGLAYCGAWIIMGAVAQSDQTAAGGVLALLVSTPAALVVDYWRFRNSRSARSLLPTSNAS